MLTCMAAVSWSSAAPDICLSASKCCASTRNRSRSSDVSRFKNGSASTVDAQSASGIATVGDRIQRDNSVRIAGLCRSHLILAVMHIGGPTEAAPLALDLERTLALVEPLYQDKALATGEPFLAHAWDCTNRRSAAVAMLICCAAVLFGVHDVLREPPSGCRPVLAPGLHSW